VNELKYRYHTIQLNEIYYTICYTTYISLYASDTFKYFSSFAKIDYTISDTFKYFSSFAKIDYTISDTFKYFSE